MKYIERENMEAFGYVSKLGGFSTIMWALVDREIESFTEIPLIECGHYLTNFIKGIRDNHANFFTFPEEYTEHFRKTNSYDFLSSNELFNKLQSYREDYTMALTPLAVKNILDLYTMDAKIDYEQRSITTIRDYFFAGKIIGIAIEDSQIRSYENPYFTLGLDEEPPYNGLIEWVYYSKEGMLLTAEGQFYISDLNSNDFREDGSIVCTIEIGENKTEIDPVDLLQRIDPSVPLISDIQ